MPRRVLAYRAGDGYLHRVPRPTSLPFSPLALSLLLWTACGGNGGSPVQPIAPWHTLIADNHMALEVDEDRNIVWSYDAGVRVVHLVERLADGTTSLSLTSAYTTDVALVIDRDGQELFHYEAHLDEEGVQLQGLHSLTPGPDDSWILTDTVNARVISVDQEGNLLWSINRRTFEPGLTNPNDARIVTGEDGVDRLWVCARGDAYSHILLFQPDPAPEAPFPWALERKIPEVSDPAFLSQPHNPHSLGEDRVLVSAAGEDRVKWVDLSSATILAEFPSLDCDPKANRPLGWERDARILESGNLLIADSNHGRVIEIKAGSDCLDESSIVWSYEALDRPYSAIRLHCQSDGGQDVCY